jgi:hypothetical protein
MFGYILLAFVVIILISIIYWLYIYNSDKRRRERASKHAQASCGTFDANAQQALAELSNIAQPTPADHFQRGRILQHNVIGGEPIARRMIPHIIDNVIQIYTNSILGLRDDPHDADPAFIIDHIVDFNRQLDHANFEDEYMAQVVFGFNNTVAAAAPLVREEAIKNRVEAAVTDSVTRSAAIDKCFNTAIKYTNDSQNVHDSKVNKDLHMALVALKETAPAELSPPAAIEEARAYIRAKRPTIGAESAANALQVLDRISGGETIGTFGDTEDRIFAYTWERCKHPRNVENAELMREAIVTALAECIEKGSQVCINGRCGRILNSLVMLDFDRDVAAGAMTFEAYKNQIYQDTNTIVNEAIDRAVNSDDAELQAVGRSYETGDISSRTGAELQFKAEIKAAIDANLHTYADKLSRVELDNLRQECYVYATL